jgi:hypothetical protein
MNIFSLFRKPSTITTSVSSSDLLQDTIDTNAVLAAAGAASADLSFSAPLPGGFQACDLCATVHQNCLSSLSASYCYAAVSDTTLSSLSSLSSVYSFSSLISSMSSPPPATLLYNSHSGYNSYSSCGRYSRYNRHSRYNSCSRHSRHSRHTVGVSDSVALASSSSSSAADNKDNVG